MTQNQSSIPPQNLKKMLRSHYLQKRAEEAKIHAVKAAQDLALILGQHSIIQDADIIGVYSAIRDELSVEPFIHQGWQKNWSLALPKITQNSMLFLPYERNARLKEGLFKTRQLEDNALNAVKPDVILVPMLAFNWEGDRLGYGKGYYDRYLANQHSAITFGVGYDCQYCDRLIAEAHDQKLDYIVTETRIFQIA